MSETPETRDENGREELVDLLAQVEVSEDHMLVSLGERFYSLDEQGSAQMADAIIAAGWVSPAAVAERDAEIERLRASLRCDARHPEVENAVPCHLDKGHSGEHVSTTGCAGSVLRWPSDLYDALVQRDEAREALVEAERRLGAVAALAKEAKRGYGSVNLGRLAEALGPVSGAVEGAGEAEGPHSRACGIHPHPHGAWCSTDCPTCGGKPHTSVAGHEQEVPANDHASTDDPATAYGATSSASGAHFEDEGRLG
jgi:hypothetical protein